MIGVSAPRWESLERWSPTLFLLGGVLLVAYATFNGIDAFTDVAYENVENVFGPAGFVLGFVGLLGLYPRLVDRSPRLALGGAVCAALGAVGFSVFAVASIGQIVGLLPQEPPAWSAVFFGMVVVGMIPGYLSFGVATRRAGEYSRAVGLLLFVPAAIFTTMLAQAVLFDRFGLFSPAAMARSAFAISGGQALAYLSVGYALRTGREPTEREMPSGDVTAS